MKNVWMTKMWKRQSTLMLTSYPSSYNIEILNSFNRELQLNDREFTIRNKLIDLLTELKGFKFVTKLVLELNLIDNDDKQNIATFIRTQKEKQLLMKVTLMIILSIHKSLRKDSVWKTDSVLDHTINISK